MKSDELSLGRTASAYENSRLADAYVQAAIGEHVHIPLNLIFQGTGSPGKYQGVFQFQFPDEHVSKLFCGADPNKTGHPHVLVLGDAFIRTNLVMTSAHLIGAGISGIYRNGFDPDDWIAKGKLLKGKP